MMDLNIFFTEWHQLRDLKPRDYEDSQNRINYFKNKILEQHANINNFQE